MKTINEILEIRIPKVILLVVVLVVFGLLLASAFLPDNHRGSDKAGCILNQRNIQQAIRHYADTNSLHVGDPIDWSIIIGVGQYFETAPTCPVHGKDSYDYSQTIPPIGVLAAPCKDVAHKPSHIEDW